MSSNIKVQRVCQFCYKEFAARTTVTRFCGDECAKKAYKVRLKTKKIAKSNAETISFKMKPLEEIKTKDYLTVKEVAVLLNCSVRLVYHNIETKKIKAVNLSQRLTRVKRSDIDSLFV